MTIISICTLALLSTISGITYSVFCDTESSYNNVMSVSTNYSIPEWIVLSMVKNVNSPKVDGNFSYWNSGVCLSYTYDGKVKSSDGGTQSDNDHNWTLIVMLNGSHALELGQNMTIDSSEASRTLVMSGCTNFDSDLLNVSIGLLRSGYFNETDGIYDYNHIYLVSNGTIDYYDTNKPEGELT